MNESETKKERAREIKRYGKKYYRRKKDRNEKRKVKI
jgi:hypothetical protein